MCGLKNCSVPVLRGTSYNPVLPILSKLLAILNISQFNYSLTHNPENKPSSKYHQKIMVAFRPGDLMPCLRCPITGGSSAPFYSITQSATSHRTNTKESRFIKSIAGKNSQSKLIYHHSSHILQETKKLFPFYQNQKEV